MNSEYFNNNDHHFLDENVELFQNNCDNNPILITVPRSPNNDLNVDSDECNILILPYWSCHLQYKVQILIFLHQLIHLIGMTVDKSVNFLVVKA